MGDTRTQSGFVIVKIVQLSALVYDLRYVIDVMSPLANHVVVGWYFINQIIFQV